LHLEFFAINFLIAIKKLMYSALIAALTSINLQPYFKLAVFIYTSLSGTL